jgi:hypothetical protein
MRHLNWPICAVAATVVLLSAAGCARPATRIARPVAQQAVSPESVSGTGRSAFERIGQEAVASLGVQDPDDPPKFVGVLVNDVGDGDCGVTYWFYPTSVSVDGAVSVWFAAALGSRVVPRAASIPGVKHVTVAIVDSQNAPLVDTQVEYSRADAASADWDHIQSQARLSDDQGTGWLPFFRSASGYAVSELSWSDTVRYYGKRLNVKEFPRHKP